MQTYSIQTTQEIFNLLENDFKNDLRLKDKHFYFIDTLIRRKANRKPTYLSSKKLKRTFGDRDYKNIIDFFTEKNVIQRYFNPQDGGYDYYTYKLLVSIKKMVDYQLTYKPLLKTINFFYQTNYDTLLDYEQQVLHNIEQLQLPSQYKTPTMYMKKSKNNGRLFHPLTNLPKKQRYQLKHKNNIKLVEKDFKNAQLVLLSQFFNDDEVFQDSVYSGEFYQILAHEMGIDISDDDKKGNFKRRFFNSILFNEDRRVIANSKYGIAFKKLFPITFYHIMEISTNISKANELQKDESFLCIHNITRDIVKSGLFVIPIHDSFIINLDDNDKVQKIIDDNCIAILGRTIPMSMTEFCPTIDTNNTTYNNIYNKQEEEQERRSNKNQSAVYIVQDEPMVGQNKKIALMNEKVAVITNAIKTLMDENQKITVRKIQELSCVSKSTVEKHYKRILADLNKQIELDFNRHAI